MAMNERPVGPWPNYGLDKKVCRRTTSSMDGSAEDLARGDLAREAISSLETLPKNSTTRPYSAADPRLKAIKPILFKPSKKIVTIDLSTAANSS